VKAVVQRVASATVRAERGADGSALEHVESIGLGVCVLLCVEAGDDEAALDWAADKTARLRIFRDEAGKMNRSVVDVGGEALVVSQFTLAGDASRGNRPSFVGAAPPEVAAPLVERYAGRLEREHGLPVARGVFGAMMQVALVNDGPVTVIVQR